MNIIAKHNKFYNLYEVSVENITSNYGYSQDWTCYKKIKKISISLEKALAKYPGVDYKEDLVTKPGNFRIPDYSTRKWVSTDRIRFGKYFGTPINEMVDTNYLNWYYEQVENDPKHQRVVEDYLIEHCGYQMKFVGKYGYLVSSEEIRRMSVTNDNRPTILKKIETNEPILFTPERQVSANGEYAFHDITFKFQETRGYYYDGLVYYLPVLNGKSKRIKNKLVEITKYNAEKTDDGIIINIEDFKINK